MADKKKKNGIVKRKLLKSVLGTENMSLGKLAAIGAAIGAGALLVSEYEKDHPEFAQYSLESGGKLHENVRLVYLSDLHEKEFGEGNERLLKMVDEADPDLVLLGGDMITCKGDIAKYHVTLELCRNLTARYPVFYGNGNHEQRFERCTDTFGDGFEQFTASLKDMGVKYLSDASSEYDGRIMITGLNLSGEHYRKVEPAQLTAEYIREHIGILHPGYYNILLAHSPEFLETYAQTGADLVLAGHYHGGTIKLPGDVGLMTPQFQFFSTNVVGMKVENGTNMIISGGLGTHSVNIRLNDKPQVVVVDIKK